MIVIPSWESVQYPLVENAQSYSIIHFTKEFKERKIAISRFQFKITRVIVGLCVIDNTLIEGARPLTSERPSLSRKISDHSYIILQKHSLSITTVKSKQLPTLLSRFNPDIKNQETFSRYYCN